MSANLLAVVIYTGAACVSPVETASKATVVAKVHCAEIVRVMSGNPYKIVQEPNVVSETKAMAPPKYSYQSKKAKKKSKKKRRR